MYLVLCVRVCVCVCIVVVVVVVVVVVETLHCSFRAFSITNSQHNNNKH